MNILGHIGTLTLVAAVLQNPVALAAARDADVGLDYAEIVDFSTLSSTSPNELQKAASDTHLEFNTLGRAFRLDLKINQRVQALAGPDAGVVLYAAAIADEPGSWGRLSFRNGIWRGMLWTGTELLAIDRSGDLPTGWVSELASSTDTVIAYRVNDLLIKPGTMSCGADRRISKNRISKNNTSNNANVADRQFNYLKLVDELRSTAAKAATQSLQIGMLGDSRFVDRFGTGAEAALLERLNIVDGIFSSQVGITLSLTETVLFQDSAADPFTSDDSSELLNELAAYKADTPALRPLGLVHLYTGRDLEGTTAGIAFLGELCGTRFSAGLSEGVRSLTTDALIAAHEIGHNFGATHDGEEGSACENEPESFLMSPSINGSQTLSACSIQQMQPEISRATCLSDLSTSDAAVAFASAANTIAVGESLNLTLNVTSPGTENINDVNVRFDISEQLQLQNIDPSSGSCATSAGGADCNIGTLSGSGTQSVNLELLAANSGSATLDATLSATGDSDSSNNVDSFNITIQRSADLSVTWSGASSTQQDANFELQLQMRNESNDSATNVTASITLPVSISFVSADLDSGSCTSSGQTVDCQLGSLSGNTTNSISITMRGSEVNNFSITASAGADEPDPDSSNNSRSFAVEVTAPPIVVDPPPPTDNSSSGGGAPAPLLLMLLAATGLLRGRRFRSDDR